MKVLKYIFLGAFLMATPLALSACEQQSPIEEGLEEVGDEIDDAT